MLAVELIVAPLLRTRIARGEGERGDTALEGGQPLLEDVLAGGVAPALTRTAEALREDNDALDELAAGHLAALCTERGLRVDGLAELPAALRRRVIRGWLLGVGATALTDVQLRAVDALVGAWRGQGGAAVSSPLQYQLLVVTRRAGYLTVAAQPV